MALIPQPFDTIDSYIAFFSQEPLPVLKHTVKELQAMLEQEDSINGRTVAALVLSDPLMTLKVLIHIEANRRARQNHDITTIERAIMMMGISPFLRDFADQPTIEGQIAQHPKALVGVLRVISRARRAARYARDWAIVRHDLDVDEVTVAALLSEVTEILCWCFAPTLTQQVYELQRVDRGLRSAVAQRSVFNFSAKELQQALVRHWHLPDLLVSMMDERYIDNARVRTVQLANSLARHTAQGWDNPAIPDDLSAIEQLIHISRENLLARLQVPHESIENLLAAGGDPDRALPQA
ncbi:HDOD domain-containing protein [uncultured Zoogloea sp.]|jgi:HD-like signal output (HDOD) protein|uniref:HDOD domain-containing protein n=1 Tax=uncultured Zoogloea sp. TaxID=160237 RepID=UPI0026274EE9|nr:HDOD domain-containing protein [uncultured Zoogloea sp.]